MKKVYVLESGYFTRKTYLELSDDYNLLEATTSEILEDGTFIEESCEYENNNVEVREVK